MLLEYKGKIYLDVEDKYVEVDIKKDIKGEFTVVPTKNKMKKENAPEMNAITVEKAYEKFKRKEQPLRDVE